MNLKILTKFPIFKRLIPSLYKKYIFFSGNHFVKKKIEGIVYFLDTRYLIDRNFYLRENYEDNLFFRATELIPKNKINYFLDIGSCWGIYSLRLSKKYKNMKILSFDPIKKNILRLKRMIKINNIKNIKIYQTALGSYTGQVNLYGLETYTPVYSLYDTTHKNIQKSKITKIDNLIKVKKKNLYIKVDIEKHEYYFLLGAKNLIKNNNIIFQIEIKKNKLKIFNLLKSNGFKLLYKTSNEIDYFFSNFRVNK